jgi:hypothetical protein
MKKPQEFPGTVPSAEKAAIRKTSYDILYGSNPYRKAAKP